MAPGLATASSCGKHGLLDGHVFKHGFDDQVGIFQVGVVQRGREQGHALRVLVLRELALGQLPFVVFADGGHAALQRFLLCFQELDRHASIQKVHGNAATHHACSDNGYAFDSSQRGVGRHVRNLAGRALGKEQSGAAPAIRG